MGYQWIATLVLLDTTRKLSLQRGIVDSNGRENWLSFLNAAYAKYINFNAYIQTCIWGSSFCVSAFNAFWLIFRNLARIVAVTGVTGFLSLIGKIMVIALTGGTFVMVMQVSQLEGY